VVSQLVHNPATDNGDDGFLIDGSGHKVTANASTRHGGDVNDGRGIRLDPAAQGTLVQQNIALHNGGNDLEDATADCADNRWKNNVAGTGTPAGCVQ
jgi:hypothetical protein